MAKRWNRSSVLSQALFHGTFAELKPGDIVEPREHEHAYTFGNARPASEFGNVYKVTPVDPVEKRKETMQWRKNNPLHTLQNDVHVSKKGFRVNGIQKKTDKGRSN